jgi:hypothetical protein
MDVNRAGCSAVLDADHDGHETISNR